LIWVIYGCHGLRAAIKFALPYCLPRRKFTLIASRPMSIKCLKLLAGEARLELATPGFGDRCSSQLSYTPNAALYCRNICADASA
jgi:hypothetical protein